MHVTDQYVQLDTRHLATKATALTIRTTESLAEEGLNTETSRTSLNVRTTRTNGRCMKNSSDDSGNMSNGFMRSGSTDSRQMRTKMTSTWNKNS